MASQWFISEQTSLLTPSSSLGLLCLGSHVRALPRWTGGVLQGSQVWCWSWSSAEITPGVWQGQLFHAFEPTSCSLGWHHFELFDPWVVLCWLLNLDEFQAHSRTRTLPLADLLEQLPALQKLLLRLIYCQVWRIRNSTKLENKKLYQASGCNSLILACHFIFHHHFAAWRCSLHKLPCTVCASPCESETRSDIFLVKDSVHFLIVLSLTEVLWALGFEGKFQNILFNQWWHHQSCWYGTVRCLFHVFICPSSEHKLHTCISYVMQYFDMPKYDAIKALEIYKRAGQQV